MKPSHAANDNQIGRQIARTRQVWQTRLGRDLTDEDARQIAENVTGFFAILAEWARAEMPAPANDTVLVVVNLDPHQAREATVWLDGPALGIDVAAGFSVRDELSGASFRWGQVNYVRLEPWTAPAHIFTVTS